MNSDMVKSEKFGHLYLVFQRLFIYETKKVKHQKLKAVTDTQTEKIVLY